jgi:hypothetical protein
MEETLGKIDIEHCRRIQHVAYLLPLLRARRFLIGHPNAFKVGMTHFATLLYFV